MAQGVTGILERVLFSTGIFINTDSLDIYRSQAIKFKIDKLDE